MSSAPGFLICYFLEIFFNMQGEKNERNVKAYYQDETGTKLKLSIGYAIMVNPNYVSYYQLVLQLSIKFIEW